MNNSGDTKVSLATNDWLKFLATHLISFLILITVIWTKLSVIATEVKYNKEAINELKVSVSKTLSEQVTDHLTDPNIHHSGFSKVNIKLMELERRIENLEGK